MLRRAALAGAAEARALARAEAVGGRWLLGLWCLAQCAAIAIGERYVNVLFAACPFCGRWAVAATA